MLGKLTADRENTVLPLQLIMYYAAQFKSYESFTEDLAEEARKY